MNTTKSSNVVNVNIRVDKNIKESSEKILNDMGFSMSTAINSFLRQVIADRSLPYRPSTATAITGVINEDLLTNEEVVMLLSKALAEVKSGHSRPADKVFSELRDKYDITF
jgi:DNA-damage-inducible protein J